MGMNRSSLPKVPFGLVYFPLFSVSGVIHRRYVRICGSLFGALPPDLRSVAYVVLFAVMAISYLFACSRMISPYRYSCPCDLSNPPLASSAIVVPLGVGCSIL